MGRSGLKEGCQEALVLKAGCMLCQQIIPRRPYRSRIEYSIHHNIVITIQWVCILDPY
jgi:hypothetical protein